MRRWGLEPGLAAFWAFHVSARMLQSQAERGKSPGWMIRRMQWAQPAATNRVHHFWFGETVAINQGRNASSVLLYRDSLVKPPQKRYCIQHAWITS